MLTAMSSGGRIGRDAPYVPRGCDMRWFTTEEVCEILGRFSQVILVGDSMLRHVIGALNIIVLEQMVHYPIADDELKRLESAIDTKPGSRQAFVLGHGLWNNLEIDKTKAWVETVIGAIDSKLRLLPRLRASRHGGNLPILLLTPNAAGDKKPDEFLIAQGNKALVRFEHAMAREAARLRIDHLGTWNMSIQANLYDGVHMDMRGNLLKAMMVVNWLNLLEE
ncbi:hypothetical protein NUW58_g3587 [Xylaria curta]|uniref:Uncharacterized protein n=1 Tax=Xylaria curta TaxID=42375 RepID=A0ACC1PBL8_9PEZI|nr:hypothetical protein NUW58_g3587 [Xylaria curta]